MTVIWHGDKIEARILAAAKAAVDETTEAAAEEAVRDRWWNARRGTEGLVSEVVTEPATVTRTSVTGRFGTTRRRGFYGLFLEYKHPFLRPAADREFPTLPQRLSDKLR